MFETIHKPKSLSKHVEATIEDAIRERRLEQGEKLPSELELCEQFGVSRTAVREALRMLQARGLVTIEKGRGMFVRQVSAETVVNPMVLYLQMQHNPDGNLHIIQARQLIEPPIAAQAARSHTAADAKLLQQNYQVLCDCQNFDQLTEVDMAFHLLLAKASGNPLIPLIMEPIQHLMPRVKHAVYEHVQNAKTAAVDWHGKILDAVLARDAEAAEQAMHRHLKVAEEHVRRVRDAEDE